MPTIEVDGEKVSFTVNNVTASTIIRASGYDEDHVRLKSPMGGGWIYDPTSVIDITKVKTFTILEKSI